MEPKPDYVVQLEAREAQAAERAASLDKVKDWLNEEQRKRANEDPYDPFVSALPIEELQKLTPEEAEQLLGAEHGAFVRYQPIAQAREQGRAAWLASGGRESEYEEYWATFGESSAIADRATELQERAHQEGSVF